MDSGYQSTSSASSVRSTLSSQEEIHCEGSSKSMSDDSNSLCRAALMDISKKLETAEREVCEKERELEETCRAMQVELVSTRKAVEEVVQKLQNDQREQIEVAQSFRQQELLTIKRKPVKPVKITTPFHGRLSVFQLSESNVKVLNSPALSVLQVFESNVNIINSPTLFFHSSDSEVESLESSVGEPDEGEQMVQMQRRRAKDDFVRDFQVEQCF
jgi:hypothetical protein